MKLTIPRWLTLFLLLSLPAMVQAQFTFTTNNGTITITGYTGTNGVVIIPSNINFLPVTSIGEQTFAFCTNLTSIMIPKSVLSIGCSAFFDCELLTNITIPNSVTTIGSDAFYRCSGLTSAIIPNSVTSIENGVFAACTSLTNLTIPNSVTRIGDGVFFFCTNFISVIIPNSVISIGNFAFDNCLHLTSVAVQNNVTNIGKYAFYGCSSLTNFTIPNGVTSIEAGVFGFCSQLTDIIIPNSVTRIGPSAFYGCTNLSALFIKGNAPFLEYSDVFVYGSPFVIVYYLPGTTGWSNTFAGRPTVLWNPQAQTKDVSFGVQSNQFGFNISGGSNLVIVVEACTNLSSPVWQPLQTQTLNTFVGTNGTSYFSDPQWTNYASRFYRLRSP